MWYSGRQHGSPAAAGVDVVAPSSGSIGGWGSAPAEAECTVRS